MDAEHTPPGFPQALLWPAELPRHWLARLARRLHAQPGAGPLAQHQHPDGWPVLVCWLPLADQATVFVQLSATPDHVQLEVWHSAWSRQATCAVPDYRQVVAMVATWLLDQVCRPADPPVRLIIPREIVNEGDDGRGPS